MSLSTETVDSGGVDRSVLAPAPTVEASRGPASLVHAPQQGAQTSLQTDVQRDPESTLPAKQEIEEVEAGCLEVSHLICLEMTTGNAVVFSLSCAMHL